MGEAIRFCQINFIAKLDGRKRGWSGKLRDKVEWKCVEKYVKIVVSDRTNSEVGKYSQKSYVLHNI